MDTELIHPDGDVVLRTTSSEKEEHGRFLVSSTFMKNASKVFQVMLSDRYAEGQALLSTSATEITIDEETDRTTIRILLKLIHVRHEGLPSRLEAVDLRSLSNLADKYDCASVIKPAFGAWMLRARSAAKCDITQQADLMQAAFLLSEREDFRHWTARLVFEVEGTLGSIMRDAVPVEALCKISRRVLQFDWLRSLQST